MKRCRSYVSEVRPRFANPQPTDRNIAGGGVGSRDYQAVAKRATIVGVLLAILVTTIVYLMVTMPTL